MHDDCHEAISRTFSCKGDLAHVDMETRCDIVCSFTGYRSQYKLRQYWLSLLQTVHANTKTRVTIVMSLYKASTVTHGTHAALDTIKATTTLPRIKEQQLYLEQVQLADAMLLHEAADSGH